MTLFKLHNKDELAKCKEEQNPTSEDGCPYDCKSCATKVYKGAFGVGCFMEIALPGTHTHLVTLVNLAAIK